MHRVNIYGFPHKGLRNALGQLSFKAGSVNIEDQSEVDELLSNTKEISELLGLHLHAEEDFVSPPMEAKIPGSTVENHEDHERMKALEEKMVSKAHQFAKKPSLETLEEFYSQINLFIREYFRHMDDEETQMNNVIWDNFQDEEILGWQGQILSKLNPDQFFKWFKYIIPALLPQEQAIMLGGFKENAPEKVYQHTIKGLEPFVSEKQFRFISTL